MVTLRIPERSRMSARRVRPVGRAIRDFEKALSDLPVTRTLANKKSVRRRLTRPLAHLSKPQRAVVLSVAAGAAFIAVDTLIAGIVIRYARRRKAGQENQSTTESGRIEPVPDEIVVEESVV